MSRPKVKPTSSWESYEKRGREARVVETTISGPEYQRPQASFGLWNIIKRLILARQPTEGVPLEYGGHREPEEPVKGILGVLLKFSRFLGPGMIITVAFIDPDNFQSDVQVGQDFQYKMLFMTFLSLLIAMYLQYLALKLGTVTGLTLAEMNHKYLPRWMELGVYAVSEVCCICTDISQVIGTAFAWNLLIPKLSLDVACVMTLLDTLIILAFYSNTGNLRSIRYFEMFVATLVLVIFVCVAVMLGQVAPPAIPTWDGFVPSREIFVGNGLFTSLAMIGGMLMPHALYVGSSIGRPRLLDYDSKHHITTYNQNTAPLDVFYRPSVRAIRSTLSYATWDLCLCIFIVGMLVNCGMAIVSAAAFGAQEDFSDLYSLYELFVYNVSRLSATLFAVALLFSGISAGIVSTMAGQAVMEGAFQIRVNPFMRRLITRCVAIVPAFIVAVSVGAGGLADALAACNYILSIGLIFISLPVVVYVTSDKYMQVPDDEGTGVVSFKLGRASAVVAWFIWGFVIALDVVTVVLLGLGLSVD